MLQKKIEIIKEQVEQNEDHLKMNNDCNDELKMKNQDQRNLLLTATNYFGHPQIEDLWLI